MSPSSSSIPPARTSKYTPLVVLGRGGMGTVYLAVARGPGGFNKLQVVKYLRPELAEDEDFLKMFLDEARLSASLNHPNIVQTNEVGQDGDHYFIAMEYVEGKTLLSILGRAKKMTPMPLGMHLRILCDALTGLHCAHELNDIDGTPLNVVHRDVSPQNVIVSFEGQVKLLDFGIAKAANSSSETRTGVLKGKFCYMAPEQMLGIGTDRRSDVFAAGVMLWHAITSERLWKVGTSDMEIFSHVTAGDVPKPSDVAEVDPELERICLRAMATKPEDRYPTAAALKQDIEAWLASSGDRTTSRDIQSYLNELYAEDRRKLKTAIEERLRAVHSGRPSLPALESHGAVESGAAEQRSGASSLASAVSSESSAPPPAARKGKTAAVLLAAVLVAVGVVVTVQAKKSHRADHDDVRSSAAAAPAPEATTTELKFSLSPADASVFLDDRPLPLAAGTGTAPRDNSVHTLRVEAPGHTPASQTVTLDAPKVFVSMALEKTKEPPAVQTPPPPAPAPIARGLPARGRTSPAVKPEAPAETAPPTSPSSAPSAAPTNEMKPLTPKVRRPLDQSDPWK